MLPNQGALIHHAVKPYTFYASHQFARRPDASRCGQTVQSENVTKREDSKDRGLRSGYDEVTTTKEKLVSPIAACATQLARAKVKSERQHSARLPHPCCFSPASKHMEGHTSIRVKTNRHYKK